MRADWDGIERAPKGRRGGKVMSATELAYELAHATLTLALAGRLITVEAVKEVRPALQAYQHEQSTIPTYLGAGRQDDGLGLWRVGLKGPRTPSRENGVLALRRLSSAGYAPGLSLTACARRAGVSTYTLTAWLHQHEIRVRSAGGQLLVMYHSGRGGGRCNPVPRRPGP